MTGGSDKRFYDWNFWGNIGSACALSKVNLFYESVFFFYDSLLFGECIPDEVF